MHPEKNCTAGLPPSDMYEHDVRMSPTDVKRFNEGVRGEMLARNAPKYRSFLRGMETMIAVVGFLPEGRLRGGFLRTYYMLMRHLDDIVDGDRPLPDGYASAEALLDELIVFTSSRRQGAPQRPVRFLDHVLAHCLKLSEKFGEDFTSETEDILHSLKFDARRRGKDEFFSEEELRQHFHRCDISGTERGCLKICDEDPSLEAALEPLGNAVRIQYNLRDLVEDVRAGLINVSREDAARFGITFEALQHKGVEDPGVRAWWTEQTALGLHLLERHSANLRTLDVRPLTRLILYRGYEKPATLFFREQVRRQEGVDLDDPLRTAARSPVASAVAIGRSAYLATKHGKGMG
ncbi:MAG: squalene/phytoene synthase family protein, partial [Candidatus Peribacteraceae bacterium]|nr:squalene/phytoene synthase family protein [Candidatus Peribacteraceae bacterium]